MLHIAVPHTVPRRRLRQASRHSRSTTFFRPRPRLLVAFLTTHKFGEYIREAGVKIVCADLSLEWAQVTADMITREFDETVTEAFGLDISVVNNIGIAGPPVEQRFENRDVNSA